MVDKLVPSSKDDIALVQAVDERFDVLCKSWQRIMGQTIIAPPELKREVRRAVRMIKRHRKGDFRHTDAELRSVKCVAQWTVDMNNILRNQPDHVVEWL